MENDKFRHELKYLVSAIQVSVLKERISKVMSIDKHASGGQYCIRSLYFDNYANKCYYENENGVSPREKFRIRIYNGDDNYIVLECKRKEYGKTLKKSCRLTKEQAISLIKGKGIPLGDNPVLRKFINLQKTQLLRPSVIVEYDRIPFVYKTGNVRVTFDMNIRASTCFESFFEKTLTTHKILIPGQHLIEVKYDELLPDFIKEMLEIGVLSRTTFSKFYMCKKYSLRGVL